MRFLGRSFMGVFLLALTLAILILAANLVRTAFSSDDAGGRPDFARREQPVTVSVITPEAQSLSPKTQVYGAVESRRQLVLRQPVGGTVTQTHPNFVNGGRVEAGDLIVKVDPTSARSARNRAEAILRDAEQELASAEKAIELETANLAAAQTQEALRRSAYERTQTIVARGSATRAELEAAELSLSSAEQTVLSRRQALAQAEARQMQAETGRLRAELDLAEAERRLTETETRAPFAGVLADISASDGQILSPNEAVARLLDPAELEVSFRLSTTQYTRLLDETAALIDLPVEIALDANVATTGRIIRESAEVGDGATGRLVFASLDTPSGFRSGDFVTVTIEEPSLADVVVLPATALTATGDVLIVGEDDRLKRQPATLLRNQGDDVLLAAQGIAGKPVVAQLSPQMGEGVLVQSDAPAERDAPGPEANLTLTPERKARLIAFVENGRMPEARKAELLAELNKETVPADVVNRLEARMGTP